MSHIGGGGGRNGASLALPFLAATVVPPAQLTLLVATACPSLSLLPTLVATARSTVALASVTQGADPDLAAAPVARKQSESLDAHPPHKHGWTGVASGRTLRLSVFEGLPDDRKINTGSPGFIPLPPGCARYVGVANPSIPLI